MDVLNLSKKYATILNRYEINTPIRLACFWAQISHESSNLERLQESLNYSVEGLLSTFGRHRITEAQAKQFGRTVNQKANQVELANILYGGKWGEANLGNTQKGDGSRFIGRGAKQITGRANYTKLSKDTGIDYLNNPEWLLREADAILSACWFWKDKNCNRFADKEDIKGLTKVINGGNLGLSERIKLTDNYKKIFK